MVDALASGASTGNGVEVRVLSWAPTFFNLAFVCNCLMVVLLIQPTPVSTLPVVFGPIGSVHVCGQGAKQEINSGGNQTFAALVSLYLIC